MPAIYWYCALGVAGVGMTVFVYIKKKNYWEFTVFFLFALMAGFLGEMIVLLFFNSYVYRPGVYSDYYAENIFGHIIPNATLWPAAALLVAAYNLRLRWIVLVTAVFTLLDVLFVRLGIYEHLWWKTWMTSAGIFAYCIFSKLWYRRQKRRGAARFITFWLALQVVMKLGVSILLMTGLQFTYVGWFDNPYRDSGIFSVFYNSALSLVCVFFICIPEKRYWRVVPFLVYLLSDVILLWGGWIFFYGGWNIFCLILLRIVSLGLFMALERRYPYALPGEAVPA